MNGEKQEVMGIVSGTVEGDTFYIFDAFYLPVEGTETRVEAGQEADLYRIRCVELLEKVHFLFTHICVYSFVMYLCYFYFYFYFFPPRFFYLITIIFQIKKLTQELIKIFIFTSKEIPLKRGT